MPRAAASIQVEIDAIEAALPALAKIAGAGSNGTTVQYQRYMDMTKRLDELYGQLDNGGNGGIVASPAEMVRE